MDETRNFIIHCVRIDNKCQKQWKVIIIRQLFDNGLGLQILSMRQ